MSGGGVPISEAARQLGVRRSWVHQLIRAGALDADRVGSQMLIDPASLQRRLVAHLPPGRPLASRQAWALLALASDEPDLIAHCLHGLSPSAVSRLRGRLRREAITALTPRLRTRARTVRLRADPSDLAEIASDPTVVRTGTSAANEHGFDVAAPGVLEAYIREDQASRLIDSYVLEPAVRPNVILHVVPGSWPFPAGRRVAPAVVAALDLLESDDERAHRAGREALERLDVARPVERPAKIGLRRKAPSLRSAAPTR
jgi:excisionase family DNA binding protein